VDGISRAKQISESHVEQVLRVNTVLAQWEQDLSTIEDTGTLPQALSCDGASLRLTRRTDNGIQLVVWSLRDGILKRWVAPASTTTLTLQDAWMRSLQLQGGEPSQLRALSGVAAWQIYFYQSNGWSNCQSTGDLAPDTLPAPVPTLPQGSSTGKGGVVPTDPGASAPTVPTASALPAAAKRVQLPKGVRVVISFAEGSGMAGSLTRDIRITP
jgi:general secretion pathway protein J